MSATPEYNASIPGAFKNALDWAPRSFPDSCLRGKHVAVIGASTSIVGAVWAEAELRKVLTAIGGEAVDAELPVGSAHAAFEDKGRLRQGRLAAALVTIVTTWSPIRRRSSGMTRREAMSELLTTAQQGGSALGVAVLSTFAASRTRGALASGEDVANALADGFEAAFWGAAAIAALGIFVALALVRQEDLQKRREESVPLADAT